MTSESLPPDNVPKVAPATAPPVWRVPGPSPQWQQFLLCIGFHLALPLFPLIIEHAVTGTVSPASAYLVASMYSVSIGASSRNAASFGVMMIVSLVSAVFFGIATSVADDPKAHNHLADTLNSTRPALYLVAVVFLLHLLERYNRHVADCEPFWLFTKEGR